MLSSHRPSLSDALRTAGARILPRMCPRSLLPVLLAAALAAAGCRSVSGMDPDGPPPIPPGIDAAHLHFTRTQVQAGDVAPDFTLPRTDGSGDLTLSSLRGRPVVLVFGSFT
jgi:hypothetical protein